MNKILTLLLAIATVSCNNHQIERVTIESEVLEIMSEKWGDKFEHVEYPTQHLDTLFEVAPGESIQEAIDKANAMGGGVVKLLSGTHSVSETIELRSGITLVGEGVGKTIVTEGDGLDWTCFNISETPQVTDIVMKDFSLVGRNLGKVQGMLIRGTDDARHQRMMFQNLEVKGWGSHGVHIKRTDHMVMDRCVFTNNGSKNSLYHNLYFLFNRNLLQSDCDFSYPVVGKGCKYTSCGHVLAQRCVIRGCQENGIQSDNEQAEYLFFHKYEVSGCGQVAFWFPCEYYFGKFNYTEDPKYAPQNVILNRCEVVDNGWGAMWRVVKGSHVINSHFDNKYIDMALLKCEVEMEGSTFERGNEIYTDVEQWPSNAKLLW